MNQPFHFSVTGQGKQWQLQSNPSHFSKSGNIVLFDYKLIRYIHVFCVSDLDQVVEIQHLERQHPDLQYQYLNIPVSEGLVC